MLYTHSQVQKAIDGLTDPIYLEVLCVDVDAEDREAIQKKVCMFECIYVYVCVYVEVLKWKYVNVIYFLFLQAAEEKKKAVEPPKQKLVKEVITRGKHKGEEKHVVVEEFSKYSFFGY